MKSFNEHSLFDVQGGLHISSGADSALMAACASISDKRFKTYTFGFERNEFSEVDNAKKIASSSGLPNDLAIINEKNIPDYLIKVLGIEYEPFSSLRILSQHHLYETFQKDSKVIFDGSGGDEIGGGYLYYLIPWYLDMINQKNIHNLDKRIFKLIKNVKILQLMIQALCLDL